MARGTVMIVDDDADLLEELSDMLALSDYRVVPCSDAASAVRIASRNKPDAILIDILMPGMNGLQVVEELRRSADSAHTPVIMMSGRCTESEGATLARINRFAGFVEKPISPFELFGLLEKVIA
jgi:twitching motility two-component system response regulator PilH